MPDDIQDIIASLPGGTQPATPPATQPATPPATPPGTQTQEEVNNATNAAFAKMRTEIARLEKELKAATEKATPPQPTTPTTPPAGKEFNEEAIAKIVAEKVAPLEQVIKQQQEQQRLQVLGSQLNELRTTYALTPADLNAFAEQAGNAGYDLRTTPRRMLDLYRELNFEKIVQAEAAKGMGGTAPQTGPRGGTGPNPTKSISEIIKEITEKTK
jgi:hypothetical protein